jgi:hypothetical protein
VAYLQSDVAINRARQAGPPMLQSKESSAQAKETSWTDSGGAEPQNLVQ